MTLRYGAVLASLQSLRGRTSIPEVEPTHGAIRYRTGARRPGAIAPLADIYVPPHASGASCVLVHGGGFVIGSRRMKPMRYLASRLFAAGIAVCAIDYRMIFRGGRLGEAIADVCDAFEFWSAQTTRLGLRRRSISLVGLSAGGTLALLAAARIEPRRLAGVVSCFGLYEIDHLRGPAALLPRLLFATADRAAWSERSPRFAPPPAVPTLLLHGGDDGLVPIAQARSLAARRESLGLPTRLVIYPGVPHGFFNLPLPAASAGADEIIAHVRAGAREPS
ncbi:MAG: alpha/beta hydrolase family protein [Acidobacteriota bacterium]